MQQEMPYKTYLPEKEIPHYWYNVRADLKRYAPEALAGPLLDPQTRAPLGETELAAVFPAACAAQEVNLSDREIPIPDELLHFFRMYRPSPLVRAYFLEEEIGGPARIFYKYEGGNTSGSHKLNSAITQAYFAKEEGLRGVVTETGAGQWGTALSMATAFLGLDCRIFMVRSSVKQKPYRPILMKTYGAHVQPSPSETTAVGREFLAKDPETSGCLGMAIAEAMEELAKCPDYRYTPGSVMDYVLLHQSLIGQEAEAAMKELGIRPDVVIACAGGGSNAGGLFAPFLGERARARSEGREDESSRIIIVESASCPSFNCGELRYDFCDCAGKTPMAKMYTLGHDFVPPASHAGGLRYHGMAPLLSGAYHAGLIDEARAVTQEDCFEAARLFARTEGTLSAPESSHAIAVAIQEARRCQESGEAKTILFCLSGQGNLDLAFYQNFLGKTAQ